MSLMVGCQPKTNWRIYSSPLPKVMKEGLVPQLWTGACVVMDNLPAHKVAAIREAIEAAGARLVYLSPYSPDFNPIENCWSKVKELLRSLAARTYSELDDAITKVLTTITTQDIVGWFTHCCYYIPSN
jgi:transposase